MNKYMILGIGIGIIITNFFYSIIPSKDVDINKLVEVEVQKRIKKIEEMKKVDESFKEVVKEDVKTENNEEETEYFSRDNSVNAVYYIYIGSSKDKSLIVKNKEKLEEFIETKIDTTGDYAYLVSEYPYSVDNSNKILELLEERFGIKAQKLKISEFNQMKLTKVESTPKVMVSKTKKNKVKKVVKQETEKTETEEVKGTVQATENKGKVETSVKTTEIIKEAEMPKE